MNKLIALIASFVVYSISTTYINNFSALSYFVGALCAVVVYSILYGKE